MQDKMVSEKLMCQCIRSCTKVKYPKTYSDVKNSAVTNLRNRVMPSGTMCDPQVSAAELSQVAAAEKEEIISKIAGSEDRNNTLKIR
jgi:hypothetical protein